MSKGKKIFIKIFFSYMLFMIIPFSVTGYIYNSSMKSITDSSKSDSFNMLLQGKNMVDTRLEEVRNISNYVSKDPDLIPILKYDKVLARKNLLDIYKLCNSIPNYQLSNSIIDNIYIICKNSNLVIAPGSTCEYSEGMHSYLFGGISYNFDQWNDRLWNYRLPNDYIVLENDSDHYNNLVYLRGLPYELADSQPGALYINIKNSFFEEMLKKIDTGKQGIVFIMDNNGNLISSFKDESSPLNIEDIAGQLDQDPYNFQLEGHIVNHIKSDMNKWTYYSIIPKKVILSQVSYIRNMIFGLSALMLILGCAIAYKLASKKAIILKRTIQYLTDSPTWGDLPLDSRDEYGFIQSGVSNLISNNRGLNERLREQKETIKNSAMRTLVFADFHDKNQFKSLVDRSNIDLGDKKFLAMTISIAHEEEDNYGIIHLVFKEMSQKLFQNKIYTMDIDNETMAAIVIFDASLPEDKCYKSIDKLVRNVYTECLSRYNVFLKFGISLIYENISKVHKAYEQSKEMSLFLLDKEDQGDYIGYRKDYTPEANLYYYPIELELKLIQFVKYGQIEPLKELLDEIYLENFQKRDLSPIMKKQLVFAMRGTIIRSLQNTTSNENINKMIDELDTAVSIEDILHYAKEISLEICRIVDMEQGQSFEDHKKDIFEYIEDSYSDCNFSIHSVAEKFDYSENAIYQYFREIIGIPFSVILDNKRIEKACEMITKTDMAMKDVALNVGYNNDTTFRRAFKRVMGVLPSEYKKTL